MRCCLLPPFIVYYRTVYTQTRNAPAQTHSLLNTRMDNNKHINLTIHEASLPVELLHVIVSHTTADYLDDLIAGQLSVMVSDPYRRIGVQLQGLIQNTYKARLHSGVIEPIPVEPDKTLEKDNPIISLLQSSVKVRTITLKILSNILGIPLSDENGIERSVLSTVFLCCRASDNAIDSLRNHGRTSSHFAIFLHTPLYSQDTSDSLTMRKLYTRPGSLYPTQC